MIDHLMQVFPNFSSLQESFLENEDKSAVWQVTALGSDGKPVGSGFSRDLNTARKIAIAEFIERSFVLKLKKAGDLEGWQLDNFPTACGFAAGFDSLNTQIRSIGEALERWALSQWLDYKCFLEEDKSVKWPKESQLLIRDFDKVSVFKKEFLYSFDQKILSYHLCAIVGFNRAGAFVGSGINSCYEDALVHAVVEAHRHLLISKQERNFNIFPFNRIKYFSENKDVALDILKVERNNFWKNPSLKFQRNFQSDLFCVSRTIFEGWTPWEHGAIDRMLY